MHKKKLRTVFVWALHYGKKHDTWTWNVEVERDSVNCGCLKLVSWKNVFSYQMAFYLEHVTLPWEQLSSAALMHSSDDCQLDFLFCWMCKLSMQCLPSVCGKIRSLGYNGNWRQDSCFFAMMEDMLGNKKAKIFRLVAEQ